jgi:hypothetical protein
MSNQLKEQLIDYLESVGSTPGLPPTAIKELRDGIALLKKPNHIHIPNPEDSPLDTALTVRDLMDNFFTRYPSIMTSQQQIDLQEQNFERFVQRSGLLKSGSKPSSRR